MRVDFRAQYKELSRLLYRTENKPPSGSQNFGTLLADLPPKAAKSVTQSEPRASLGRVPQPSELVDGSDFASLNLSKPVTIPPIFDPIPSRFPNDDSAGSVKTPTVLEARRIPSKGIGAAAQKVRVEQVRQMVNDSGKKHGIDPALSMAVVSAESSFNPTAVSSDGFASKGLFQLLDKTGAHLHKKLGRDGDYNPFDPETNVDLGVGYLRHLHEIFNKRSELPNELVTTPAANYASLEKFAVAAFNAGEGRVASAQERAGKAGFNPAVFEQVREYLPDSTREYVDRVFNNKSEYEEPEER